MAELEGFSQFPGKPEVIRKTGSRLFRPPLGTQVHTKFGDDAHFKGVLDIWGH